MKDQKKTVFFLFFSVFYEQFIKDMILILLHDFKIDYETLRF